MSYHRRYVPIPVKRLGVMLRLHRRHKYIKRIFKNFRRMAKGRKFFLAVQLDRPSADVAAALDKELRNAPDTWTIDIFESPIKLVDQTGENYMEALQHHYEYLLALSDGSLDAACLWDDDSWLEAKAMREFLGHLDILEADRVEIKSRFLWDDPTQHNTAFPVHWQALLFRVLPRDRYPTDYMVHCPDRAAQGKCIRMKACLTNAGYLDPDDRRLTWLAYRRAGKIDAHTVALIKEPKLERLNESE